MCLAVLYKNKGHNNSTEIFLHFNHNYALKLYLNYINEIDVKNIFHSKWSAIILESREV